MTRRLPLIPTVIVLAAVLTMIGLGVWQLQRRGEKERLIARYQAVEALSSGVPWPRTAADREKALYRHSSLICDRVIGTRATAGRGAGGESGWAHVAHCALDGGGEADVVLGWSRDVREVSWSGGEVLGFVAPGGPEGVRLLAQPPLAGLAANARPDPREMPNNHLAYAIQWFFFAATAVVIYLLALRGNRRAEGAG